MGYLYNKKSGRERDWLTKQAAQSLQGSQEKSLAYAGSLRGTDAYTGGQAALALKRAVLAGM